LVNQGGQRKSHTMVYLTRAETVGKLLLICENRQIMLPTTIGFYA